MSNLKYAFVEEEVVTSTTESMTGKTHPKQFVVSSGSGPSAGALTRRVEAAVDVDFANGSMPA